MDPDKINSITLHRTDLDNSQIWRSVSTGDAVQHWNTVSSLGPTVNNSEIRILELEKQVKELLDLKIDSLPMITSGIFSLNSEKPVSPTTLRDIHEKLKEAYDIEDVTLINASGNLEDLDISKIRELIKLLQDIEFKNTQEHLDKIAKASSDYLEAFYKIIKTALAFYDTPYLESEVIVRQAPQASYDDQEIVIKFKRN